ncbi:cytochrome P450 monooxygenase 12 [Heterobasidion irregulare TC 32-1]|uniref:Cytochrome P450 monooxygenase 12 n=1 Tax=Heterobasidion irregulare (strain TC 32-1) TaxID=747525 RepID=W4K7Q0_HETIT|nr:cytochrome P450 monooxygenase 12 [Heterobasidion irregulare TC 32-1]ETW81852.1 cytochrome P450 monooxygenase 12 [Heterobasidion irregulare TC 32-1]
MLEGILPAPLESYAPLLAAGVASVAVFIGLWTRRSRRYPLPPGPKSSWFGKVKMPNAPPWRTYSSWQSIYGDIIYIYAFGNPIIILNSAKAANDLLDKRSAKYSSRPVRIMVQELMGLGWLFSSMPYGNNWRKHRALFQKHFHSNEASTHQPTQIEETHALLRNLHRSPDKLAHHLRRSFAALVMKISYGHQIEEEGDMYVGLADQVLGSLSRAGLYGTYLVDYIPLLRYVPAWMPGAGFQKQAREWRKNSLAMINKPYEMVKQKMASGTAVPCFTTLELEEWNRTGQDAEHEILIKQVAAISYGAGTESNLSALLSFFLAMMVHPEVQRKAQAQIDSVIGPDRLPDFSDRDQLPYVDAIVWECLRWNPSLPLGVAHYTTEDDVYEGYYIPKGTTVLANIWNILHNPEVYPDPSSFNPDRFEDPKKSAETGINILPDDAFGYGRRMCPGRWLAFDTLWITLASILAVYDVQKPVDKDGNIIEPEVGFTSALFSRPKPYSCKLVPRSEAALGLVLQTKD